MQTQITITIIILTSAIGTVFVIISFVVQLFDLSSEVVCESVDDIFDVVCVSVDDIVDVGDSDGVEYIVVYGVGLTVVSIVGSIIGDFVGINDCVGANVGIAVGANVGVAVGNIVGTGSLLTGISQNVLPSYSWLKSNYIKDFKTNRI